MNINLDLPSLKDALVLYVGLLSTFHKMTEKESEVAVELALAYMSYLDKYKHPEAAAKLFMETSSRAVIIKNLGCTDQVFRNYIVVLKKKGIVKPDGSLSGIIIPKLTPKEDSTGNFLQLVINLNYAQEKRVQGLDAGTASE